MDGPSPQPGGGELSPTEFASAVTAITTAFGDPTRREIYLFAHEREEGITAGDTAKRFDLHANVARHHLDKLAAGGHLEIELARPDGGVGRPSKRYRATSPHVRLEVSIRHDDILVSLLGRALAMLPSEAAERMAEEVGIEYGKAMAAAIDPSETHRSYQGALHADGKYTVSRPGPSPTATSTRSSPRTARSATPSSSIPSSARSTAASCRGCSGSSTAERPVPTPPRRSRGATRCASPS